MRRRENDLISVSSWVEEVWGISYNPIRLFMVQGQSQLEEMDNMTVANFVLTIQTQFQCDAFQAFGNVVCVDASYVQNQYVRFQSRKICGTWWVWWRSTSGMGYIKQRGYPLADWALKWIKDAKEPLHPQWLMSDDAQQFISAWKAVLGGDHTRKLLFAWHVDWAWWSAQKRKWQGEANPDIPLP